MEFHVHYRNWQFYATQVQVQERNQYCVSKCGAIQAHHDNMKRQKRVPKALSWFKDVGRTN